MANYEENPFSSDKLQEILQISPENQRQLVHVEIDNIEYKRNYTRKALAKYARIMAGFANNEGGYIVFGVDDATRELLGMSNDKFDRLTPEDIGSGLNNIFAPSVKFDKHIHVVGGKRIGLLYTFPAKVKPIVSFNNADNDGLIRNGDIFYRYGAEIERIRYPELAQIIEERQEQQLERWLDFMRDAARIGVDRVRLLNMFDGTISGTGGKLVISQELLEEIKFIEEGSFDETDGEPTLRVIGNVAPLPDSLIEPTRVIDKPQAITSIDVYHIFLEQKAVDAPLEYLKLMCHGTSKFMPVYFFMQQAEFDIDNTVGFLKSQATRSRSRDGIVERLECDNTCEKIVYKTTTDTSAKCKKYKQQIIDKSLNAGIPVADIKYALRGMRMLDGDEVDSQHIFPIVRIWFDQYFTDKTLNLVDDLKRAICYLDCLLYRAGA